MYPSDRQINPDQTEEAARLDKNPEASSLRGLWSDPDFLQKTGTPEFNKNLRNVQFADAHGHGWMFKNVYKKDRKGNLLDAQDNTIAPSDPDKFGKAVHLKDIHLEKGMHCADCHFQQDSARHRHSLQRAPRRGRDRLYRLSRHDKSARKWNHQRICRDAY